MVGTHPLLTVLAVMPLCNVLQHSAVLKMVTKTCPTSQPSYFSMAGIIAIADLRAYYSESSTKQDSTPCICTQCADTISQNSMWCGIRCGTWDWLASGTTSNANISISPTCPHYLATHLCLPQHYYYWPTLVFCHYLHFAACAARKADYEGLAAVPCRHSWR